MRLAEAFVEQAQQEVAVEGVELVLALFLLAAAQAVAEVVAVAVEKALALDEIDEHQAVEHDRGIPFPVGALGDAVDELEEGRMLLLEPVVEALGHALHVQAGPHPARDVGQRECFFFVERKGDCTKFLDESVAGLRFVVGVLPAGGGLSRLALHPLPDLGGIFGVRENDDMLVGMPGRLLFDLPPQWVFGDALAGGCRKPVDHHAAFLRHGGQGQRPAVEPDFERGWWLSQPSSSKNSRWKSNPRMSCRRRSAFSSMVISHSRVSPEIPAPSNR